MLISKFIWRYYINRMKGKFIVLEGLDRCGKSSMAKYLQEKCSNQQQQALKISFPNRTSTIGVMINDFLNNKTNVGHEAIHLLFSANRWQMAKQIQQNLNSGKNIICDRYWYSGVAYSYAKGLDFQWCMAADKGLKQPDMVILLKGDAQKLAKREGYGNQRFEKVEFQQKVAQGFDKIVNTLHKKNIKVVDVDGKTLEQVKQQVFKLVDEQFCVNPE